MRGRTLATLLVSSALITTLAAPRTASAGKLVYLSIGDSIGFGETTFTNNPSNGDRGFVANYADSLAGSNGGYRPTVVNLAVDGETTSSLSTGTGRVAPAPGLTDPALASMNTNYTDPSMSQHSKILSTIANQLAAGNTIGAVSVSLGSNDLFSLAQSPGFLALPADQQAAKLAQTLGAVQANYTSLLTDLHAMVPAAHVLLIGSYNPFPAAPTSPFAAIAGPAIDGLNKVIAGEAKAFGTGYVDTASAFKGNESAYTHILDGPAGSFNVHPNGLGYGAIAVQMHAVPEPTTFALLGTMAVGFLVSRRFRGSRIAS